MTAKPQSKNERTVTLDVSLLGRDYKVACKEGEEADLREAVALLDRRMREIRESSKTQATERVAVMAALNLAHDLQRSRAAMNESVVASAHIDGQSARRKIAGMRSAIDKMLAEQEKR
jgi:cell division protein ZapA